MPKHCGWRAVRMPTYEYECKKCGLRFEKFQSIMAKPVRKCPECGGRARRLLGMGAAIISKGSGGASRCGIESPCGGDNETCDACPYDE